jgi:hypothetical protein
MTKRTNKLPQRYSTYPVFAPLIPVEYRKPAPVYYQRTSRGTFPKYVRAEGKKSNPALFLNQDLVDWADALYGLQYPDAVKEMAKVLGVSPTLKKKGNRGAGS